MRLFASMIALLSIVFAQAQLTPRERKGILDGLTAGSLLDTDLSFSRKGISYPKSLAIPSTSLEKPIEGAETTMSLHVRADKSIATLLRVALEEGFGEKNINVASTEFVPLPPRLGVPPELVEPVGNLVAALSEANASVRESVAKLTVEEKRQLIESLALWAAVGTEIKFDFVSKQILSKSDLYQLLEKVELSRIRSAALKLASRIEEELPKIRGASTSSWAGTLVFSLNGVNVELSGVGDDVHKSSNTNLCIDLGGRNRYTGRYGAGIGYSAAVIDFGTESIVEPLDASCGVGIVGIGLSYFMGAKPDLYGKNISFGAGLAGVGAINVEQSFRMDSRSIGQGFGSFGVGILSASKGTDTLKLGYLGQGAAVGGGFGWCFNPSGNDRYRVGGIVLETDEKRTSLSRAQGFSGILPGGIGLLTDSDGDDLYEIGSEGQAFASGFGLGSLYDYKGKDTYIAQKRAQSCAFNEGSAGFYDLEGDDILAVRESECHAFASDRAVAVLIDRSGDDLVTAKNSQPGFAQEGAFSLFLDGGGADRFAGPVGIGVKASERFGFGMFIDLGGDDRFIEGLMSGTISVRSHTGVSASFANNDVATDVKPIAPGSVQATSSEIDMLWLQVNTSGPKSLESSRRLVGIGQAAFERFCDAFAADSITRSRRTAAQILSQLSSARSILADKMATASSKARAALFDVASYAKVGELRSLIGPALQSPDTRLEATRYAGVLGAKEFIEPISSLVLGADALTSQQAVLALAILGDEKLVSTMEALMNSDDMITRHTAIEFVARFPRGYELGKSLLSRQVEEDQITGIELLALSKDSEGVRLCGAGLNSPFNAVRIKALTILNGRVPEMYRNRVIALMSDSNNLVSAVARGIDIGR